MKYGAVIPSHPGGKSPKEGEFIGGIGGKGVGSAGPGGVCFASAPARSGVDGSLHPLKVADGKNST